LLVAKLSVKVIPGPLGTVVVAVVSSFLHDTITNELATNKNNNVLIVFFILWVLKFSLQM
jgi:predicted transcriptional regulator